MYDIHIGKTLHRAKITANTVFVTCVQESTGTLFGIPVTSGKVFHVLMNGHALVPYTIAHQYLTSINEVDELLISNMLKAE